MGLRITQMKVVDLRFQTSQGRHGSDAMNPDPDYSCPYVTLSTNAPGLVGHGLTFTIGRGNEICVLAVKALERFVVGRELDGIENDLGGLWRQLVGDSQLRWLGPEKGVVHLAAAAVINAVWDILAKRANKPIWEYVADMPSDQLMQALDLSYVTDFLTPERALELLEKLEPTRHERVDALKRRGYPAYTTSVGWLGYSDQEFRKLLEKAAKDGWTRLKIKVGEDLKRDCRRLAMARELLGNRITLMVDANQVWEVNEAISAIETLAQFDLHWVEEPTSPDDILGHQKIAQAVEPVQLAGGEHCHNRIMFKQFLQASALSYLQVDACRLAGLNEVLVVCLMAADRSVPICPHAGGIGLSEYAQHISMIDFICVSGKLENRLIEHAGQLHDVFAEPIRIRDSGYLLPERPGFSVDIDCEIVQKHTV